MNEKETTDSAVAVSGDTPPETGTESPTVSDQATGEHQGTEPVEATQTANKEAAKYRRQLREAEGERDQFEQQVTSLQSQIIEANLDGLKVEAWRAAHPTNEGFINDDGSVNLEAVSDGIRQVRSEFGIQTDKPLGMRPDMTQGSGLGSWTMPRGPEKEFEDAFKPRGTESTYRASDGWV